MTSNVEFYEDSEVQHRWRIKADNGEIVAASSEGFTSKSNAVNNLLMTYTMLSVYVAELAKQGSS